MIRPNKSAVSVYIRKYTDVISRLAPLHPRDPGVPRLISREIVGWAAGRGRYIIKTAWQFNCDIKKKKTLTPTNEESLRFGPGLRAPLFGSSARTAVKVFSGRHVVFGTGKNVGINMFLAMQSRLITMLLEKFHRLTLTTRELLTFFKTLPKPDRHNTNTTSMKTNTYEMPNCLSLICHRKFVLLKLTYWKLLWWFFTQIPFGRF